jgi:hypothetical protein
VDYRLLLKKYIRLVVDVESIDYIEEWNIEEDNPLTREEWAELKKLSAEESERRVAAYRAWVAETDKT